MRLPLILICVFSLSSLSAAGTPGVAVNWDPHHPNDKVAAIWMAYLVVRCSYRLEHKIPLPQSGEIVPTFDEEVFARQTAAQTYRNLKTKDKDLHDDYWETLSEIDEKDS
jgi:hypothetical protein